MLGANTTAGPDPAWSPQLNQPFPPPAGFNQPWSKGVLISVIKLIRFWLIVYWSQSHFDHTFPTLNKFFHLKIIINGNHVFPIILSSLIISCETKIAFAHSFHCQTPNCPTNLNSPLHILYHGPSTYSRIKPLHFLQRKIKKQFFIYLRSVEISFSHFFHPFSCWYCCPIQKFFCSIKIAIYYY